MLSTELLFRLLTNFLGGQRPTAIFHGIVPVTGFFCTLASGDILRPVPGEVSMGHPALCPAMWRTVDCMNAVPGLRVAIAAMRAQALASTAEATSHVTATATLVYAPAAQVSTTTTTAVRTADTCRDPRSGIQRQQLCIHIVGDCLATAHTTLSGRGLTADVLSVLLRCLATNGALTAGATIFACPRVFFDADNRPHVFVSARPPGSARPLWLFAPEWTATPFRIPWTSQLDGEICRDHPAFAAPGHVVMVASSVNAHFTLPLHMLTERCVGIQSLLFRAQGPDAHHLSNHADLRAFCRRLVEKARGLLGEACEGNRFIVAGMQAPPLLCCAGTPLPPSLAQAQHFYDERLRAHFGAMRLRDTACLEYDLTLFVQRQDDVSRRIWLLPMEGGWTPFMEKPKAVVWPMWRFLPGIALSHPFARAGSACHVSSMPFFPSTSL